MLSNATITPRGPTVPLRVVGMAAAEFEFPSDSSPSYDLYATTAFAEKYSPGAVMFNEYAFRLRGGARLAPLRGRPEQDRAGRHRRSLCARHLRRHVHQPAAVGWWILTALAALVGVIVLAQALARQDAIDAEDFPVLRAVGATRRQLFTFTMVRTLLAALAGVVGAMCLAAALSVFTPVGEARLADPNPGFDFDTLLLVGGAALGLAALVALGIWPAIRASRPSPATTVRSSGGRASSDPWLARELRPARLSESATHSNAGEVAPPCP